MVKIALDAMGGDHGYKEMVKGATAAASKDLEVILVGDEVLLKEELKNYSATEYISIVHASEIIGMEEEPALAYKKKKDASVTVATRLVKEGKADAIVSAGSTGAQMAAGIFVLGRLKGISRPAIVTYYPTTNGVKIMLDGGSTPDCDKENLHQFALMATVFGKSYLQMNNPTVGLLNNGSEEKKGSLIYKETYPLLKEESSINFYGNIEGRDVPAGVVDIVVCDGFVGNIVLKLMEGMTTSLLGELKKTIMSKTLYKLGGSLLKGAFKELKAGLDYTEYGGAPLLGVKGITMICHGSSDGKTMMNALYAARKAVESGYYQEMRSYFEGEEDA